MGVTLALAGDTMLGRGVAERLTEVRPQDVVSSEVVSAAREADLFVLNLECCISQRGEPWADPRKPFFFRAPPVAVDVLTYLEVDCVTMANNHALDFGPVALADTIDHLDAAGIAHVGAGRDQEEARAPAMLSSGGLRVAVIGISDHPADFAAGDGRPGIAFADLRAGVPPWVLAAARDVPAEVTVVMPHWGPNMTPVPVGHVRAAARELLRGRVTLVAGHSAHVFHGVEGPVLYDLGDFLDDYAVDPVLRNDLGLLFLVTVEERGPVRLEALPLALEYCHTRVADGEDREWIRARFRDACRDLGTEAREESGRLVVEWP